MAARWTRFLRAYYIWNLLSLASYFALRNCVDWTERSRRYRRLYDPGHLWYWEKRAFWMLLALAAGKLLRRSTLESYLAELSLYLRLAAAILLCSADARLGAYLLIAFVLSFVLFVPPRYDGPSRIELLTPASLQMKVLKPPPTSSGSSVWFVMCTAPWSSACSQAQETFASLSLDYASDRLQFGEIDVGRWSRVAQQLDVSTDALPHQLPAFLLFKHGKVVKRVPKKDENWDRKGKLRQQLIKEFDLDMLLAAGLNS